MGSKDRNDLHHHLGDVTPPIEFFLVLGSVPSPRTRVENKTAEHPALMKHMTWRQQNN